jgi:hypothetical protein
MPFTIKTLNAFEMTHRAAACEIPAKYADHRAFVGIYPPMEDKQILQWRVTRFEIPFTTVFQNFGQEDLVDFQSLRRDSLEEIEEVLRSWGIASSLFDAIWKCDWPL